MITTDHLTIEEKKAISEIKESVQALTGERLKGFYLFGSKARGDYHEESDTDIAILVEGLDRELKGRIINIVVEAETKYTVVISALVLSQAEFDLLRQWERRIALDIEREGIKL